MRACSLKTLYVVSALGTKLCFYSLDTKDDRADIVPKIILSDPHGTLLIDSAPADRWNYDILEPDGEHRLRQVVEEIMDGCAALNADSVMQDV